MEAYPATSASESASEPVPQFDLDAEIERLYSETSIADPGEFADALASRVPAESLREVMRFALRHYVRVFFSRERMRSQRPSQDGDGDGGTTPFKRSWKFDAVDALTRERVCAGENWRQLGDCGRPELRLLAEERVALAEQNQAKAEFYRRLERALSRHKAERVRDLPRDVLERIAERPEA